jgi:TRAP-type C4-dicarboxylate transport system substrate-binding protein
MKKYLSYTAVAAISLAFAGEAMATEWNVSVWGKRRAFTEHVEKLAELVSEKTGGEFTFNISYGGLSNERENLDGISIGAFEMAQFCAGYHPDKNPSLTVLELPFLGVAADAIAHAAIQFRRHRRRAAHARRLQGPDRACAWRHRQGHGGGGRGAHLDVGDRGASGDG